MAPEPVIDVAHLTKVFDRRSVAVDDISFQVFRGELLGFLGSTVPREKREVLARVNFSSPYVALPSYGKSSGYPRGSSSCIAAGLSPMDLRRTSSRNTEFLTALMVWGVFKIGITVTLLSVLAFVLYQFNIFTLGFSLIPLFMALVLFAWAVGMIVTAIILRFGQSAEFLAWSLAFLFQPFGAVFYPISIYPDWLARVLTLMPLPHVFEGMREVLAGRRLPLANVWTALALDAVYLAVAFAFFGYMFTLAREQGLLLKAQE